MKIVCSISVIAVSISMAWAQSSWIEPRTITDNGTLYFISTFGFRATNSSQGTRRAYTYTDSDGVRLARGVPEGITNISSSGDGSVVALTFKVATCTPFNCAHEATTLRRTGYSDQGLLGRAVVSTNGRWVLVGDGDTGVQRIDLTTGERADYPRRGFPIAVASDGTALVEEFAGPQFFVWTGSAVSAGTPQYQPQWLDDSGSAVYYAEKTQTGVRLHRWLTAKRDDSVVLEWNDKAAAPPSDDPHYARGLSISRDGGRVVFLSSEGAQAPKHAWVAEPGQTPRMIETKEEVVAAAVSGDGRFAYLVTGSYRVLRVTLATMEMNQVVAPTPVSYSIAVSYGNIVTPGAFLEISTFGLPDRPATSLPIGSDTLAGVSVKFDAEAAKLLSVSPDSMLPGRIEAQAPWDLKPGKASVDLNLGSPFSYLSTIDVRPIRPLFYDDGYDYAFAKSYHGNPPRQVGVSSPILPGETVTLYLASLGPVTPAVETGHPAPSNPPARLIAPIECGVAPNPFFYPWPDGANVEVLWAGLAPGTYGVYQVTVRWPMQFPRSPASQTWAIAGLGCRVGDQVAGITAPTVP